VPSLEAGEAVEGQDDAPEHAGVAGPEVRQRLEETLVLAAQGARSGHRAGGERQADLEAQVGRDRALLAEPAEQPVRLDRVVDARPRVPAQPGHAAADLEHRRHVTHGAGMPVGDPVTTTVSTSGCGRTSRSRS
jgi:hypothetical protein